MYVVLDGDDDHDDRNDRNDDGDYDGGSTMVIMMEVPQ